MRGPLGERRDVQRGERLLDPRPHLGVGESEVERPEGHVLPDRGREELVVGILHHQLNGRPQPGQPLAVVRHRPSLDGQLALARPKSPAQQPHQCRLAAAVAAEQGQRPPLAHLEVQAVEHGRPFLVGVGRAPEGDQLAHDRGPSSTRVRAASATSSPQLAAVKRTEIRASGTSTRSVPS